ncbi:MAG TPA: ATP-binding protein [Usitatibacter sp.]|nr:ATP-binding protein [Usitatibacter sp.]
MQSQRPTPTQLRVFSLLALCYAGLTLALLPWSHSPGPRLPQVIAATNGCIAIADACTAALLGREFMREGRSSLLLLASAYAFSGVMALVHLSVFPGAVLAERLFGTAQTTAWVFIFWRLGTGVLLLATVLAARRSPLPLAPGARARWLGAAWVATLAASGAVAFAAATLGITVVDGTHFTGPNLALIILYEVLCGTSLAFIWRARAFDDLLFLWLSLVLVASMSDQLLGTLSGAQYTIGWHAAKASSAISACLLLVCWLSSMTSDEREGALGGYAAYGAACGVVLGALLLRWFVTPWAGLAYPFATLFGAIAIAVWIGGWRPALLAAMLGYVGAVVYFVEPIGHFSPRGAANGFGTAMFWASAALIIGLGEAMRRARDRYRASEELFRQSQEGALQGFALLEARRDAAGGIAELRIRYVNPAGAGRTRNRPEDLVGRSLNEVFPGAEAVGLAPMLREVIETGRPADREVHYEAAGIDRWYRHLAVRIGDGAGTSYVDVTHTKRLEAQLRQRAADLQRADANKGRFLALLSHELRNPLAPLANGLALLGMGGDAELAARTRAMMQRQIHHMSRLIDDLLDLSRIDQGKLQLQRQRIALEAALRSAIETARPSIEQKGHRLELRLAEEPLHVDADPVRLSQVVANLLHNAAKFTPAGGTIELSAGREADHAVVRVHDDGIGFAAGDEERIFEMFVQLDESRGNAGGGLGLGLTLVRSLVGMHGGEVRASSPGIGKGAVFSFRLPLAQPAPAEVPPREAPAHDPAGRRVLVVDDNRDAADTLAEILRLHGFDARAAYDGAGALRLARERAPQVAFLDLDMPGMKGIELAQRLRALVGAELRLGALTGLGSKADIDATRAAGFHAHLTKPAAVDEVIAFASAAGHPAAVSPVAD